MIVLAFDMSETLQTALTTNDGHGMKIDGGGGYNVLIGGQKTAKLLRLANQMQVPFYIVSNNGKSELYPNIDEQAVTFLRNYEVQFPKEHYLGPVDESANKADRLSEIRETHTGTSDETSAPVTVHFFDDSATNIEEAKAADFNSSYQVTKDADLTDNLAAVLYQEALAQFNKAYTTHEALLLAKYENGKAKDDKLRKPRIRLIKNVEKLRDLSSKLTFKYPGNPENPANKKYDIDDIAYIELLVATTATLNTFNQSLSPKMIEASEQSSADPLGSDGEDLEITQPSLSDQLDTIKNCASQVHGQRSIGLKIAAIALEIVTLATSIALAIAGASLLTLAPLDFGLFSIIGAAGCFVVAASAFTAGTSGSMYLFFGPSARRGSAKVSRNIHKNAVELATRLEAFDAAKSSTAPTEIPASMVSGSV